MIEIPLNSSPEQIFSIKIENQTYDCRVILNSRLSIWTISFSQSSNDIVIGVPLLSGIDILKQYNIQIKNVYVVNLDVKNQDPSKDNLGTSARLFILTEEEITSGQTI